MLDFLSRVIAYRASLPGTHLLVFTLVIWAAFSLVLLADARNQLNQWCFTGGMMFSVGALKEYLYYGLGPSLIASGIWTQAGASLMYSVLSAAFYLLAIPCVMMFAFYFAQLNQTRFFPLLRVVVWLPAVCLSVRFPPDRVASLQRDPVFCLSIAGYNVLFGLIATLILLRALWMERHGGHNRQRRLVAVSVLLPLWVWLVAAFPYHALGIPHLDKIWQIELPVVLFTLCFLLYHAFREGIWGMRLRRETYDWSGSGEVLQRNTQYVAHALKNDLNKIDWCAALLDERLPENRELQIIRGSVDHLRALLQRTRMHTGRVVLSPGDCDVRALFEQIIRETPHTDALRIEIDRCDDAPLYCDPSHVREALTNLVGNAVEAMRGSGRITLSYVRTAHKASVSVCDDGPGMTLAAQKRIFEPYYTTKTSGENFGLGAVLLPKRDERTRGQYPRQQRAREGLHLYPDFSAGRTREAQTVSTIRIMLVEDDLDYRYLIEQALRREADFELCTSCTDGKSAVQTALMEQPDIVLMDLCLAHSPIDGAEASRQIRLQTDARVIILTSREDFETVIRASTHAFASAYLFKSNFPVLIPMIRQTAQGVTSQAHLICSALLAPLTDAERSVLRHLLGEDVRLHSASKTISNQQTGILRKLGLPGKKELTHIFSAYGLGSAETQAD